MQGGAADDEYIVDNVGDVVIELDGEGYDQVKVGDGIHISVAGTSVERIWLGGGTTYNNGVTANALNNLIDGSAGNNFMDGGAGADTMLGYSGNDTYVVDSTYDKIQAGLQGLQQDYAPKPPAGSGSAGLVAAAAYSERFAARTETFDMQVTTRDGDRLRISVAAASASWSQSRAVAASDGSTALLAASSAGS